MATGMAPKGPALPLWRRHQQVILPVVFICADGYFVDSSNIAEPGEAQSFEAEGAWISDVARSAHEQLTGDSSAVDVVHYVLNELSRSNGRWPYKTNSEFYQSSFMMDGETKRSGAVGCFRSNKIHAVDAARYVQDNTEYHLLCGDGAREYIESVLPDKEEPSSEDSNFVFDNTLPLSVYVIAADRNGSIACGSFDEHCGRDSASILKDAVLLGNGMYADSHIGSAIAISLNKTHKTSGLSMAWLTTQFMRDFNAKQLGPSLSSYLSKSLRRYIEEPTVIFALHRSGNLPTMKMSIYSFSQRIEPDMEQRSNMLKCAALSLVGGAQQQSTNRFHWSTILTDLRNLSTSSLFDAHPYGMLSSMLSMGSIDMPNFILDDWNGPVAILVHGGAGAGAASHTLYASTDYGELYVDGVKKAAVLGYRSLAAGKTAVEAVIDAVREMENNYVFNSGFGSYLTRSGHVEMDAMIQDGQTGRFGSVGAVKNVRNVIDLASAVMNKCNAEEIVGGEMVVCDRAFDYAKERGIATCEEKDLICEKAQKAFEFWQKENETTNNGVRCGTVGAVAIDRFGNVAAATSTGGLTGKIDGRIGDSPMPGCGTAADNELGAVSATGIGEHIMATCLSRACLHFMHQGNTAQQAADMAIEHLASHWLGSPGGGQGGVICISPAGPNEDDRVRRWGLSFNTEGMCWACVDEAPGNPVLYSGLEPGELYSDTLPN